ncbi:MAG: hypothetical protein KA792_00735 [Bacteroidales bacterium]|nr:hypothetical protein [Bacteroidales bacterium]
MLPNWKNRPEITAHLINPAFCSEILRECVLAYKGESKYNFPFALSVLVLPLILNNGIRKRLPKNKSNTIHRWINENEDLKIGLANNIKSFIPFTRETIMFAIAHNSLSIDENGNIDVKPRKGKGKLKTEDDEIKSCIKKAEIIGKIFSKSGNPLTIYSILGIKP